MNAVGIKSSMLKIQFFSCYDNKNKILAEHNSTVKARFFLKNTWRKNVLGISCEAQIIHEWSNWGNILQTITENIEVKVYTYEKIYHWTIIFSMK